MKRFAQLPQSLQILFFACALMPLAFLAVVATHVGEWTEMPSHFIAYTVAAYAVGPGAMATLLLRRSRFFLYAYGVQTLLFLSAVLVVRDGLPAMMHSLHMASVTAVVATTLMLLNKDILFPFLFKGARGFRRDPRLVVNRRVTVYSCRLGRDFGFMIEDCSRSGLALYAHDATVTDLVKTLKRGDKLVVTCDPVNREHQVPVEFLWRSLATTIHKIGLRATDAEAMRQFYESLLPQTPTSKLKQTVLKAMRISWVRRAFNYVVAAALIVHLSLPALTPSVRGKLLIVKEWLDAFGLSEPNDFETGSTYTDKDPEGVTSTIGH